MFRTHRHTRHRVCLCRPGPARGTRWLRRAGTATLFGGAVMLLGGSVPAADEGPVPSGPQITGELDVDTDDGAATVAGDRLRGAAALEAALGREAYFRSLSAVNLQRAIDRLLDNRREQIASYYEMRELRDRRVQEQRNRVSQADAERLASEKAPERLSQQYFYPETGRLFWPDPLGAEVLEPYTGPIDRVFEKRAESPKQYGAPDADVVQRMVGLIQDAIETLEDDMAPEDYVRALRYLDRVAYEARFNAAGERVDLPSSAQSQQQPANEAPQQPQSQSSSGEPTPPPDPQPAGGAGRDN